MKLLCIGRPTESIPKSPSSSELKIPFLVLYEVERRDRYACLLRKEGRLTYVGL